MSDILFGNNNRAIAKKLAGRSFKKNKLRNLITIAAIILTATLFTSIATIGLGAMESITLTMQIQKGTKADADLRYMTREQLEALKANDMVQAAGLRMPIGFLSNTASHNVELNYMDEVEQDLMFSTPEHGAAPKAVNEIATTDLALSDLGIEPEIGAIVPVTFRLRGQDYHFDMVLSGWWEAQNPQYSIMLVSEAFIEENAEIFPYTYYEDRELAGTYFSDVVMRNTSHIDEQLDAFVLSVGGEPNDYTADNYVAAVVNQVTNPNTDYTLLAAIAVFVALFVFAGYLLIYNIFDISVTQEIRHYGLLRTIGTSGRQIKRIVRLQAVWLSITGIPIGLLLGFLIGKFSLPTVLSFMETEYRNITVHVSANPLIFIIAAVFTAFTVAISIRKPARAAARISSVEASRYTGSNTSGKRTKKNRSGTKISKMAFANLGRNRRRTAFIVTSLVLCVILLNCVGIAAQSVDVDKYVARMINADYVIANSTSFLNTKGYTRNSDTLNMNTIREIAAQPGVNNGRVVYKNTIDNRNVSFDIGAELGEIYEYTDDSGQTVYQQEIVGKGVYPRIANDGLFICNVYGMSASHLSQLEIIEGESDPAALQRLMEEGNSVILGLTKRQDGTIQTYNDLCEIGQTITAHVDGSPVKTYTVIAKVIVNYCDYELPLTTTGLTRVGGGDAPLFYFEEAAYLSLYDSPAILNYSFNVEDGYKEQLEQYLNNYRDTVDRSLEYTSSAMFRKSAENMQNMIYLVGGIIGVILGLTGVINLINMVITSILTRRYEFAAMQSIGMTSRQLRRMMMFESSYYALFAGLIGCAMSLVFGITLVKIICDSIWFLTFNATLIPAILLALMLLVIAFCVPVFALRVFNKGSVVERLRTTE